MKDAYETIKSCVAETEKKEGWTPSITNVASLSFSSFIEKLMSEQTASDNLPGDRKTVCWPLYAIQNPDRWNKWSDIWFNIAGLLVLTLIVTLGVHFFSDYFKDTAPVLGLSIGIGSFVGIIIFGIMSYACSGFKDDEWKKIRVLIQ